MTYDQFVGEVQNRAHLPTAGDAVVAIQATFNTLAERLSSNEIDDIASQLPRNFANFFQSSEHPVHMSVDEFFQKISEREQRELAEAMKHAGVVMEVLQEAVSADEIAEIRTQLPPEWNRVFGKRSMEVQQGDGTFPS